MIEQIVKDYVSIKKWGRDRAVSQIVILVASFEISIPEYEEKLDAILSKIDSKLDDKLQTVIDVAKIFQTSGFQPGELYQTIDKMFRIIGVEVFEEVFRK